MSLATTARVPRDQRDWDWAGNARRRMRLVAEVLTRKGRICHLCGGEGATTADHLLPRAAGGLNELANLAPAHRACNTARGGMPLTVWFARNPRAARPAPAPSREW